jgi:hypothetical protein
MPPFSLPFTFPDISTHPVQGCLDLDEPLPCLQETDGSGFYRTGRVEVSGGANLDLVLYNNRATARFIYLRKSAIDLNLLSFIGIAADEVSGLTSIVLPGQLCMGSERSALIAEAIHLLVGSPILQPTFEHYSQQNLAVFPIAREGLKYNVAEAIFGNYGLYCDEIVLDAHHVFNSSIPVLNRSVEFTLFKDKDLDQQQKENIAVAFIADSIASGLVMKEVIARIKKRFEHIQQVEVVAPLATIRGLCNLEMSEDARDIRVRVHVFETLLNALPPDYYYSAHYPYPGIHIQPDLDRDYRDWWGEDDDGNAVADTACAGYGWSEAFYSPRKQIQMMNSQLMARHGLTIADIVRRNLRRI